jgi:phosphatidylserine decarboxylase
VGAVTGAAIGGGLAVLVAVPLAWKWQLGVVRATAVVCIVAAVVGVAVAAVGNAANLGLLMSAVVVWTVTLAVAAGIMAYRFYRDPDRIPPTGDDVVVSPADGTILYVHEVTGGELPVVAKNGRPYHLEELTKTTLHASDAAVIGIGLNFLDVHVNRAPIAGRITLQERFPGHFGSLRNPAMIFENERTTIVIERAGLQVAVVLIASRLVRRIVLFLKKGDEVDIGQRIGAIRFGSQADLVIPANDALRVMVRPGDSVVAGETVLALSPAHAEAVPGEYGPSRRAGSRTKA